MNDIECLLISKTRIYNFVTTDDIFNCKFFKIIISEHFKIKIGEIMWVGDRSEYENEKQPYHISNIYDNLSGNLNAFSDFGKIELIKYDINILREISKTYVLEYGDFGNSNIEDIRQLKIEQSDNGDLKIIFKIRNTKEIYDTIFDQISYIFNNYRLYEIIISNTGKFISGKNFKEKDI